MSGVPIVSCGLLGLGIVLLSVPAILEADKRHKFSRARDLHHTHGGSACRFGGLAIVAAFLVVETFIRLGFPSDRGPGLERLVIIMSSVAMFGLGFWDDLKGLSAKSKLAGHLVLALVVWCCGIGIESIQVPFVERTVALGGGWSALVTVIWLVGFTNLINLIDGVDGLAGGICFMLMALLVYVGSQSGTFVLLTAGTVGALLGFLRFNFPPARIYLGDGGAYFLGFQIGLFSIVGSQKGSVFAALIAPLLALTLPIVDTLLTILRRSLCGLPIFRPDRGHIHHLLLATGMSQRKTVLWLYAATVPFLCMGIAAFWSRGLWVPIFFGLAVVVVLLGAGKLSGRGDWFSVSRALGRSLAMRQEVHYARFLRRWLLLESERCASLEELFYDLASAARRLGFTLVRLRLVDGVRDWTQDGVCAPVRSARHSLQDGAYGIIEFETPACQVESKTERAGAVATKPCAVPCCRVIEDPQLFQILSELLAEAWTEAARKWKVNGTALRFDEKQPAVGRIKRRPPAARGKFSQTRPTIRAAWPSVTDGSVPEQ